RPRPRPRRTNQLREPLLALLPPPPTQIGRLATRRTRSRHRETQTPPTSREGGMIVEAGLLVRSARPVVEVDDAVSETAFVQQFEIQTYIVGQRVGAATN